MTAAWLTRILGAEVSVFDAVKLELGALSEAAVVTPKYKNEEQKSKAAAPGSLVLKFAHR